MKDILQKEEKAQQSESPEAPPIPDAFAHVLAANLPLTDPEVAKRTKDFLEKQSRLLELQAHHLEDLHHLQVRHMHGQSHEGRLRRTGMRIRLAFQIFFAAVATAIVFSALIVFRDAMNSHSVIIEPFRTPPDLAGRGINGEVVASAILDELTKLQRSTRSSSAAMVATGAWSGDIKVEIPNTGLSIGEIYRTVRERVGHDVHIGGDLIQGPKDQLLLTARGPGIAGKTFTGASDDIAGLAIRASEYIYSQSQPVRWVTYLVETDRNQDAFDAAQASLAGLDDETQARMLNIDALAAQNLGKPPGVYLPLLESAIRLKPDLWPAHTNIIGSYATLGREEDAWRYGVAMEKQAGGRPGKVPELYFDNFDVLTGNYGTIVKAIKDDVVKTGGGSQADQAALDLALLYSELHDMKSANVELRSAKETDEISAAGAHLIRGKIAWEQGDLPLALSEMRSFYAVKSPAVDSEYASYYCALGPIEEASGNPTRADEVFSSAGTFVNCLRYRADVLDHRGNWVDAQAAYAKAVSLAPDLPSGYYGWGAALLRHGDLAGAAAKLADAHRRGPHWADPLKVWGDLLAMQGHTRDAREKYDSALLEAPEWRELKEARAKVGDRR